MGALISGHMLALIAMIVGTILLIVEMYIPGFGIAGISGVVLSAVGLIAMGGSAVQTLILAGCELALLGVALASRSRLPFSAARCRATSWAE